MKVCGHQKDTTLNRSIFTCITELVINEAHSFSCLINFNVNQIKSETACALNAISHVHRLFYSMRTQ